MVRAAVSGAIDFDRFDSQDSWWQTRLNWVLHEISSQLSKESAVAQQTFWAAKISSGRFAADSLKAFSQHSLEALKDTLRELFPWHSDIFQQDTAKASTATAAEQHAEIFGRPGEARYEAMVDNVLKSLSRGRMTPLQKQRRREQVRQQWKAKAAEAEKQRKQQT